MRNRTLVNAETTPHQKFIFSSPPYPKVKVLVSEPEDSSVEVQGILKGLLSPQNQQLLDQAKPFSWKRLLPRKVGLSNPPKNEP